MRGVVWLVCWMDGMQMAIALFQYRAAGSLDIVRYCRLCGLEFAGFGLGWVDSSSVYVYVCACLLLILRWDEWIKVHNA